MNSKALNMGQFHKEITLVVFACVIYACKVRLVNTKIQEKNFPHWNLHARVSRVYTDVNYNCSLTIVKSA